MNHPRRLLLIPLALLGAALLVRARLPRPQTEGDKWLWEQAEREDLLGIGVNTPDEEVSGLKSGLSGIQNIQITDRQGIRAVLCAFHGTPAFSRRDPKLRVKPLITLALSDAHSYTPLGLVSAGGHYYLTGLRGDALTDDASVKRFLQAVQEAVSKARHKQRGYTLSDPVEALSRAFDGSVLTRSSYLLKVSAGLT